jgi:phosphopantetheinyl transferase
VSISHVDGSAVAVLTDRQGVSGVGIDLERCGRMKAGMERAAFSARERQMLDLVDADDRQAWALRLWCAKEASAKATGGSVSPLSTELAIEQIDPRDGTVRGRYAAPDASAVTWSANTARDGEWIVATCLR